MSERRIILDLCGGTGAWSRPYALRSITPPGFARAFFESNP